VNIVNSKSNLTFENFDNSETSTEFHRRSKSAQAEFGTVSDSTAAAIGRRHRTRARRCGNVLRIGARARQRQREASADVAASAALASRNARTQRKTTTTRRTTLRHATTRRADSLRSLAATTIAVGRFSGVGRTS
jgi:hypothetical protein